MRARKFRALALAAVTCLPCSAFGDAETPRREAETPALGTGLSIPLPALLGAGLAAAVLAAQAGGGGDDGSQTQSAAATTPESGASPATRTLAYTSAADFRTPEYGTQSGLAMVKAESLYYNGHYRWYVGDGADAAGGTGIGVKIAVADTGINAREGSTSGAIVIDAAASYDYVNDRAGPAADDRGHGTHVAGIIAAPRNGAGMHGLAYNASVVSFKVANAEGIVTASDAELADMFSRAAGAGAMILNNSWSTPASITSQSAQDLLAFRPQMIEASRAYVARGGVVVFAAGNEAAAQPALEPGLPHRIGGLQAGWLAVVAVDGSGALASYSNACGVAAGWCLAAPGGGPEGGIVSMHNDGGYTAKYGTSMAAPHASAALGALKSMFPNLTYLQLRDRLLFTANRGGRYADASVYGQGLMDLAAASSPVGGVAVPTEASANGALAAPQESGAEFRPGTLAAIGMQPYVLVVDNYQRAPFWVPAQAFFREAQPRLVERQWASLKTPASPRIAKRGPFRFSHAAGLASAFSADYTTWRFGFSSGAGGEAMLGAQLGLARVPGLAAPAADSVALGYAAGEEGLRLGFLGTLPAPSKADERTLDSSAFGTRRALGIVAQQRAAGTTYGFSFALADGFERPIGLASSGAFGVSDGAAASSGAFVEQALGGTMLHASLESASHHPHAQALLFAPGYSLHSASFGARTALGERTLFSATWKREWSGGEAARLDVPLTIDENGTIGHASYALPYDALLGRTGFTLRLEHRLTERADLRAAFTHERDGFGATADGFAALLEIRL